MLEEMGWATLFILLASAGMVLTAIKGWKFYPIVALSASGAAYTIHNYAAQTGALDLEIGWLIQGLPFLFFFTVNTGAVACILTLKNRRPNVT